MLWLLKYSQSIGCIGTVVIVALWLTTCAIVMDELNRLLAKNPFTATIAHVVLVCLAVWGGFIGFVFLVDHMKFRLSGYRIKWIRGNRYAYEEQGLGLVFYTREIQGQGYPIPCTIRIQNDNLPAWAVDRRQEIPDRIALLHGSDRNSNVRVVESVPTDQNAV